MDDLFFIFDDHFIQFRKSFYFDGHLAIVGYCLSDDLTYIEPYCHLTVNFPDSDIPSDISSINESYAFLDINNCSDLIDFLERKQLISQVFGCFYTSGFVDYPLYNIKRLLSLITFV
ncbi:MAG: DUF4313 domain-containing protein [archaeon]|nr:DUF4313 domain-containing protein [archaeon]